MEKDCIFLLADKQMEYTFKGFLERNDFHMRLGTRPFTFEIAVDYQGNDPGVYNKGHELLRPYCNTHEHAVVVLDQAWQGAPSAQRIKMKIRRNLTQNGWRAENVEVIVIEPELETWIWQDSPHIARAFTYDHQPHPSIRAWLEHEGLWRATDAKPARPKEAFEQLARKAGLPLSSAIYHKIAGRVSVHGCIDPAFCLLRETLQSWFPNDGGAQ